jgi:divalent metal cation (Fe/Co/Zn/Cd) transporter
VRLVKGRHGDVLASSIVVIGMGIAARPADANHPYGHGRFETLSAFVVGVILAAGGVMISYQWLQAVGVRHEPPGARAAMALAGAIVLRGVMSAVKLRVGRSTQVLPSGNRSPVTLCGACESNSLRFVTRLGVPSCGR